MKLGEKVIIKKNFSFNNQEGSVISSIPGLGVRKYLIKMQCKDSIFVVREESEFLRNSGEKSILLKDRFCIEQGTRGTIVHLFPGLRYLCEFEDPICNIELTQEEIMPWSPATGIFAVLDRVQLKEDIPAHHLKKGIKGTIILVYFQPELAYEVEFDCSQVDTFVFLPHQLEQVGYCQ